MGLYTPKVWTNAVDVLSKFNMDHLETQYDLAITIVRKTADQTVNDSAVLVNDTHLLLPIAANEVWVVKFYIYHISSAVADFKMAIVLPALCACHFIGIGGIVGGAAVGIQPYLYEIEASAQEMQFAGSGANMLTLLEGLVINGANAGNVQFQWAQVTAEATDTKVLTDSYIVAHRVL